MHIRCEVYFGLLQQELIILVRQSLAGISLGKSCLRKEVYYSTLV